MKDRVWGSGAGDKACPAGVSPSIRLVGDWSSRLEETKMIPAGRGISAP